MRGALNELFIRDRVERNMVDFEGSGVGSGYYDEKEDKKFRMKEIRMPLCFLVVAIAYLSVIVYMSAYEYNLYKTGTKIEAEYSQKLGYATIRVDNKKVSEVSVDGLWGKPKGDTIDVYVKDGDYATAQVLTSPIQWAIFYGFFGGLVALIIFWIYKILHKTHHAKP